MNDYSSSIPLPCTFYSYIDCAFIHYTSLNDFIQSDFDALSLLVGAFKLDLDILSSFSMKVAFLSFCVVSVYSWASSN